MIIHSKFSADFALTKDPNPNKKSLTRKIDVSWKIQQVITDTRTRVTFE